MRLIIDQDGRHVSQDEEVTNKVTDVGAVDPVTYVVSADDLYKAYSDGQANANNAEKYVAMKKAYIQQG